MVVKVFISQFCIFFLTIMIDCTEVNNSNKKFIAKKKYKEKSCLKESKVDQTSKKTIQSSYKYCLPGLSDVQQIKSEDSDAVHSQNVHYRTYKNKDQSPKSFYRCYKPQYKKQFSKKIEVAPRYQSKKNIKKNDKKNDIKQVKSSKHHQSHDESIDCKFVKPCKASDNDQVSTKVLEPKQDRRVQKIQRVDTKENLPRYRKRVYSSNKKYEFSGRCFHNLKFFDSTRRNQQSTHHKLDVSDNPEPDETEEIKTSESLSHKSISEKIHPDYETGSLYKGCSDLLKNLEQESFYLTSESCKDQIKELTNELEKLLSDENDESPNSSYRTCSDLQESREQEGSNHQFEDCEDKIKELTNELEKLLSDENDESTDSSYRTCSDLQESREQESSNHQFEDCEDKIKELTKELEKLLSDENDESTDSENKICSDLQESNVQESSDHQFEDCEDQIKELTKELEKLLSDENDESMNSSYRTCLDLQESREQESSNIPSEDCEDQIRKITEELEKLLSDENNDN
ncbi:hypothetical protein M153_4580002643 [Pseudoloma neurophilia]|uniref:Uncharacterized protein n=1 Tax=Pseudoloma neurophilia TaxID=146866 RepID=A0A0R0LXW3_9MICR|nr:hypothetical protein M153_4580002643 [Pseudoloma neurophilia]